MQFADAYNKLNTNQKLAVDTLDGPVMVVAGPGTGKTQVLALRIANILQKTDIGPSGILCLTFTRSGVTAMRDRLESYIGTRANDVVINTFHSFAISLVQKHFDLIGFEIEPKLIDDAEGVFLVDEILHDNDWEHLRPRTNPAMYFGELKSLISLMKRERLTHEQFLEYIETEIKELKENPDSISSRGESKGSLKKDVEKKIESLERTKEVVQFYKLYEERKRGLGLMDYDDVLYFAVRVVEISDEARADVYENYQYVLVDEHQDSSAVQNNFLKAVWGDFESMGLTPNIFVVGDDRQLIYGFSGANINYFTEFKTFFGKAKLITLTENYRSTSPILALADDLLSSSITEEKLRSNSAGDTGITLAQYVYERDEILGAGLYFKQQIAQGIPEHECALLVPKNRHVRNAVSILSQMGLHVSSAGNISLFSKPETESLLRVLSIVADPFNAVSLSASLLDKTSGIPPMMAHTFLRNTKPQYLTIGELTDNGKSNGLFDDQNEIATWGKQLESWISTLTYEKLSLVVATIGNELLINKVTSHDELLHTVEVVRSFIHTALAYETKHVGATLPEFLEYIERLKSYGNSIELATFGGTSGIQVMTLHRSKGLEYKAVWIAHMNEQTLMSEKRSAFTLPEKVKEKINERTVEAAKRELYVAITRAKELCTISYAKENYGGGELELARIVADLDKKHFIEKTAEQTETELLVHGPKIYTEITSVEKTETLEALKQYVKENFEQTNATVTLLNNFFECPWKWYFRNFLKLPEVKGVSLALGSAVHSTIEFILKEKKLPTDKILKAKIEECLLKEGVQDKKELKDLSKSAEKAVSNWIKNYYEHLAKDHQSERSLQFRDSDFPQLKMYGKLDLTETFPNGDIVVTDFKTGKPKTKSEIEKMTDEGRLSDYMRQLAMYSYLVRGGKKDESVSISKLLFLEAETKDKNALYSAHISQEQIDLLKRDIGEYNQALQNGTWIENECHFKPWGGGADECPYCALSKRIFN